MELLARFACTSLAVLLAVAKLSVAAPADDLTEDNLAEVFNLPEYYDEGDLFVPPNESSFDPFDWRLCQILHKSEPGNAMVSPISLKLVLAMVYEGAENNTALELKSALNLPASRLEARTKYHDIVKSLLVKKPEYVLDVASKLYVRKELTPRIRYSKILRVFYEAQIENIDFAQKTQAVETMNAWISNVTHGHIKSMFEEDVVSPSTMMILLNAMYFKGFWRYPFSPNLTKADTFNVSPSRSVSVPFMSMTQNLHYSESVQLDAKILRLPYKGKKYSMFIVLPNKVDGLDSLLQTVNPFLLRKHMFLMDDVKVNLLLPKFNFEYTTDLGAVLQEMGIREMFSSTDADLPGIVLSNSVYVSKVLQKSGLEVNEEGTEAYVATAVSFDDRIGGETVDFFATHPFMFFILDETTGTVIFVGKVVDPVNGGSFQRNKEENDVSDKIDNALQGRFGIENPPVSSVSNKLPGNENKNSRGGVKHKTDSAYSKIVLAYLRAITHKLYYKPEKKEN